MNEFAYAVALAIIILTILGAFREKLGKLKSVQVKVDFSDENRSQNLTKQNCRTLDK